MRKIRYRNKKHMPLQSRYELDFGAMADGISLSCGGMFEGRCIIPSSIGYTGVDKRATELYDCCLEHVLIGYTKVQGVYIGPEATKLWHGGIALAYVAGGESAVRQMK